MADELTIISCLYSSPSRSNDLIIVKTFGRTMGIAVSEEKAGDAVIWFDLATMSQVKTLVQEAILMVSQLTSERTRPAGHGEDTSHSGMASTVSSRLGGDETDGTITVSVRADNRIGIGIVEEFEYGSDAEVWTDAVIAGQLVAAIEQAISAVASARQTLG